MSPSKNQPKKPKTVELVKSTYQPTKAEMDEQFRMDHPGTTLERMEALADGLLQPIKGPMD